MAAANCDLLEGQFSDGYGQLDRDGAEAYAGCSVCLFDVVDGESGDRRGPLGVEEQQQAGEAVFGLEGAVVQKRRAVSQRASTSIAWEGPFHLTAGKLRSRVIFWERAHRTKWPASRRRRTSSLVVQRSRSVWRQVARVRFWPASQFRRLTAVRRCCRATWSW